jgi:putative glutamine amidotransferase
MRKIFVLLVLTLTACIHGCHKNALTNRPLIGITSDYETGGRDGENASTAVAFAYVHAVLESGGTPLVLPTIQNEQALDQYLEILDGLVLIGGADIPPSAYGQKPHETVRVMADQRYNFERKLIESWLRTGKPVLGICLGMQFTSVVAGGSMIQDIPSQIGSGVVHRGERAYHNVNVEAGSVLEDVLGAGNAMVYSNHHQAVNKIGRGLRVVARSDDGIVEAMERTGVGFGLFVQWHPEAMEDIVHRKAIFSALVTACQKRAERLKSN